jgi:hypothetical protein
VRVFPVWPHDSDVRLLGLRAEGAFLGALVNPWYSKRIDVYRDGQYVNTLLGDRVVRKTEAGATVVLGPEWAGRPADAG